MSVSSFRELGRTLEGEVGGVTVAKRRFAVILDDNATVVPTANLQVIATVGGGTWGVAHPEFSFLRLRKATLNENFGDNPYHVEVTLEYSVIPTNLLLAPTSRSAEWVYEAVPGDQLPALFFFDGATKQPLTNSAFDFFEGLTVPESLTRVTITRNYANRPNGIIASFGFLNSDSFSGAAVHHCKHEGSKVEKVEELWGNVRYNYWRTESQILFRPSGWNLQLPDVGFNFISGGQKRRAMVFDFENSEWIPSAGPLGLDGSGALTGGYPAILDRRVLPETSFSSLFGSAPA